VFIRLDKDRVRHSIEVAQDRHAQQAARPNGAYGPSLMMRQLVGVLGEVAVDKWLMKATAGKVLPRYLAADERHRADLSVNDWEIEVKTFERSAWARGTFPLVSARHLPRLASRAHVVVWCSVDLGGFDLSEVENGDVRDDGETEDTVGPEITVHGWTPTHSVCLDGRAVWHGGRGSVQVSPNNSLWPGGLVRRLADEPLPLGQVTRPTEQQCGHVGFDGLCWTRAWPKHWTAVGHRDIRGLFHIPGAACRYGGPWHGLAEQAQPVGDFVFDATPCDDCFPFDSRDPYGVRGR
jgi:hypothetical protein